MARKFRHLPVTSNTSSSSQPSLIFAELGIPDGHHDPRHLGCHKSLASYGDPRVTDFRIEMDMVTTHLRDISYGRRQTRKRTETEALRKESRTENSNDSHEVDRLEIDHVSTPSLHLSTGPKTALKRSEISQWIINIIMISVTHPYPFILPVFTNLPCLTSF